MGAGVTLERIAVRSCLTLIVLAVSAAFFPFLLLLKLAEGVLVAYKITESSVTQVWAARGIPDLDPTPWAPSWLGKRPKD